MANPTSNFNWQMPTPTDLVTDLPADFEVFGQAVDSSMADLLGGTTGQILAKNSNTNMDFVWVTNDVGDITEVTAGTGISGGGTSGAVTITNSMATEITAKGDLIVGTGNAAFDNLPAGTNGHVLTADSTVSPTGLKWAATAEPAWTTWSPTVTGLTKGNGTEVARYRLNGKMVDIFYQFTLGSTSSITGQVYLTPPFNSLYNLYIACAFYSDSGAEYPSAIFMPLSVIYFKTLNASGTYLAGNQLNGTTPFTWGTGDFFNFNFSYEVA